MKENKHPYHFEIFVQTSYLHKESLPEKSHYVFSYTITIKNSGTVAAQLMTRHWSITDADGKTQEVKGDGVVGKQPHLNPTEEFTYTSGTYLATPLGFMKGNYHMVADNGNQFDIKIPTFRLEVPHILH